MGGDENALVSRSLTCGRRLTMGVDIKPFCTITVHHAKDVITGNLVKITISATNAAKGAQPKSELQGSACEYFPTPSNSSGGNERLYSMADSSGVRTGMVAPILVVCLACGMAGLLALVAV